MNSQLPKTSTAFLGLLRADFTVQWRNRRSAVLIFIVPVLIMYSWKGLAKTLGNGFVMATCITVGLIAIGLMGYSNTLAKDRDRGIFQRLRVSPVPSGMFMISRLTVQLVMIMILTAMLFVLASTQLHFELTVEGYVLGLLTALLGGGLYLGLGQIVAGLLKNAETVNATSRLIYFMFILVGMIGSTGLLGSEVKTAVQWSPYGTVSSGLAMAMQGGEWTTSGWLALLATLGYGLLFSFLGIKWFRWNVK